MTNTEKSELANKLTDMFILQSKKKKLLFLNTYFAKGLGQVDYKGTLKNFVISLYDYCVRNNKLALLLKAIKEFDIEAEYYVLSNKKIYKITFDTIVKYVIVDADIKDLNGYLVNLLGKGFKIVDGVLVFEFEKEYIVEVTITDVSCKKVLG